MKIARDKGFSGYIQDAGTCWPAVHRLDAARLYRLALEQVQSPSVIHAVGETGVSFQAIAETIGKKLGVPTQGLSASEAETYFTWFLHFAHMNFKASSEITRETYGWTPTQIGLLEDIQTHY